MTELLRCANCGIADENVVNMGEDDDPYIAHPRRWRGDSKDASCRDAALALLERSRPYVIGASQLYKVESAREEARALLAQMPKP